MLRLPSGPRCSCRRRVSAAYDAPRGWGARPKGPPGGLSMAAGAAITDDEAAGIILDPLDGS